MNTRANGKVAFAVGTGRCGTKFISEVIGREESIASTHERNRLNETFHRYCKWYELPIDDEGFLYTKHNEISRDLKRKSLSFESSAYLSYSIHELYHRFNAKFILLIRSPDRVVNSYLRKGWYKNPLVQTDPHLAPGYQKCDHFHHFLARTLPKKSNIEHWNSLSRVGKLAWYWNQLNKDVLQQFQGIPDSHWRVIKLEEMTYSFYQELAAFLGFNVTLPAETYSLISNRRPNSFKNVPEVSDWSASEIAEFETEAYEIAVKMGYEYRVARIRDSRL